jgi:hypothetical protein
MSSIGAISRADQLLSLGKPVGWAERSEPHRLFEDYDGGARCARPTLLPRVNN